MEHETSIEKGDRFEDDVFRTLSQMIDDGLFLAPRENTRILRKPRYYSKDREKEIEFDISVEISFPGETRYSVLCIAECKDLAGNVPVDDLEEFHSKLQQVGAHKGIVFSRSAFQSGA